jgi:hypothetical protein
LVPTAVGCCPSAARTRQADRRDHNLIRWSASRILAELEAAEVGRLIYEARDLNLPVEPGVRDGRNALVRWAVLLQEVLP